MRNIYPVKYYSDEGFVEHKIELGDEDLEEIIREYLERHADFDFDEVDEAVVPPVQGQRGTVTVVRPGVQPGQLPPATGAAQADRAGR